MNNSNPTNNYDIDECTKSYMENIKKYTSLKKEEEHEIAKAYKNKNDIEARNKLITSNLKYACKLANKYRNRGVPFSNLISEANDALFYAVDKFDPSKDTKLISYAQWWINQYLHKLTENNEEQLEDDLPTERDYQMFDDNPDYAQDYNYDSEYSNTAFVEDEKTEEINDTNLFIEQLYSGLNEREIQIINMKYGRYPYEQEYTLEDIGKELDLTKERVRQILEKSITKMRSQAMLLDCKFLTK